MRKIEIQLKDETLTPDDTVEGHVLVTCNDDFQCERLFVTLFGDEVARVVIHAGKVTIVHEDKREHVNETLDLAECLTIPLGESRYAFSFKLPSNIPGSYRGPYGSIKYNLKAKAELSWARDLKSEKELIVLFEQREDTGSIPKAKSGIIESDGVTLLKVEIDKNHFVLGNDISFRYKVDRMAKIRSIRAEIIRLEHIEPKGHSMDSRRTLAEKHFPEEDIRRDSWIEIKISTNSKWYRSFISELIKCSHILKITLDIALRLDKVIEIPIVLERTMSRDNSDFDF